MLKLSVRQLVTILLIIAWVIWDEKRKGQTSLISPPRPVKSLHIGNFYFIFLITVLGIEFQKDYASFVTIWSSCTSFPYKYCSCDPIVVLGTKGGELYNCELIELWVDGSMTAEQLDVRFLPKMHLFLSNALVHLQIQFIKIDCFCFKRLFHFFNLSKSCSLLG